MLQTLERKFLKTSFFKKKTSIDDLLPSINGVRKYSGIVSRSSVVMDSKVYAA